MHHPVLALEIDDIDRPCVGIAHWRSNRAGEAVSTRAQELDRSDELDALVAQAGSIEGMSANAMRAFVSYRRGLARYGATLRQRSIWLDGAAYVAVDIPDPPRRLITTPQAWARAAGEAAALLADWAPEGDCPVAARDLWRWGVRPALWPDAQLDQRRRLLRRVRRCLVLEGDPEGAYTPDLAAIPAPTDDGSRGPGLIARKPCGERWADGQYLWAESEAACIYRVAAHCGDLARDPLGGSWRWIREASPEAYTVLAEALDLGDCAPVAESH